MNSNRRSCQQRQRPPGSPPEGLAALAADVDDPAAQDLAGLPDAARAERVLVLRRLLDRLEACGRASSPAWMAAGRPGPTRAPRAASTASWLRARLPMGASAASSLVRTARACSPAP